jgi:hypothetical protein
LYGKQTYALYVPKELFGGKRRPSRIWIRLGVSVRGNVEEPDQSSRRLKLEDYTLPELSRFYGIVIRMFVEAGVSHKRPHFHAYCGEHAAAIALDTLEILGGNLPRQQQRLVEAWGEIHRQELEEDWGLLQSGRLPVKIDPLR